MAPIFSHWVLFFFAGERRERMNVAPNAAPVNSASFTAPMQEGGGKKRKAGKGKKRSSSPKPKPKPKKAVARKNLTIKERIKAGAKVYVGDRGGLYIVYDGKKHPVPCGTTH